VITPLAQRRMRSPSPRKVTSSIFVSWASLLEISPTDVSDDLSPKSLSLRVAELENALCNQDKLLCKIFYENKKLNLEVESVFLKLLLFDP
jgi:hypothetical protein